MRRHARRRARPDARADAPSSIVAPTRDGDARARRVETRVDARAMAATRVAARAARGATTRATTTRRERTRTAMTSRVARGRVATRASSEREGSLLDAMDDACPVPRDQRPRAQYEELRDGVVQSWPARGAVGYAARVTGLFGFFYGVIAYPIACGSYDPTTQFTETCVSALVGASGATAAMVLNMYNGWSYVRDRLLSATVEYEETGWYDGQVYVKDPEMLARDRLLGTYTVRPVVEMLRKTLIGCGATAMISLLALRVIDAPSGEGRGDFGAQQGYYSETSAAKYEEDEEEEEDMEQMQARAFRWAADADAPAIEISRE